MRAWIFAVLVGGCYQPAPPANAPCGPNGECPAGFECRGGLCTSGVLPDDAAPIVDDARLFDAPRPIDAPIDAISGVGCADGEREAFEAATNIAGCAASWTGAIGLRATATGIACGDDSATPCGAPADACGFGWHVCGIDGEPSELTARITQAECSAAGGAPDSKFVAAFSHCSMFDGATCSYDVPRACADEFGCSEPVCCGAGCRTTIGCGMGAFPMTGVAGSLMNGCGMMLAADVTGVMCCR